MREKITGESSLYLATNSPTPLLHPRNETHVSNHPRNLEKSMDHCRQDSRTFTVEKNRLCPIQREVRNRVETRRISRRGSVYTRIQMTFTGQAILSYDPAEKNIYG